MNPQPKVIAVVLNWNDAASTLRCVEALRQAGTLPAEIVVVDNGSTEAFAATLESELGGFCHIIETGSNLGYAGGLRPGVDYALDRNADLVWILNNDTIVESSTLAELLCAVARHGSWCMYSPRIMVEGEADSVYFEGRYLDDRTGEFKSGGASAGRADHDTRDTVSDVVQGSCMLVPARVFRELGPMPEDYFLYMEEYDYSFRLRRREGECVCVGSAVALHACGRSLDTAHSGLDAVKTYYRVRNGILFWRRWCPPGRAARLIVRDMARQFALARVRGFRDAISRARLLGTWHGLIGRSGCTIRP